MALNATPKTSSPPATVAPQRPTVNYGVPTATSARVAALKTRLSQQPTQPIAPRVAGSTARQEEYANKPKYNTPTPQLQNATQPMSEIEPPPGYVAPGTQPNLSQTDNIVETPKPVEANNEPLSPQFVALAKQEQRLRKAQRDLKAAKDAWQQQQAGFIKMDEFKSDPLKYLTEAGISNDRLVELQIGQASPDPNLALTTKIQELEAKLAAVDEQFTKRDTQQYEAAVNQIRADVKLLVDSDPVYETIKSEGATEDVVDLIKRVFDKEGTVLSVEDAAKLVEDKLVEREFERLQRLSKLEKIKAKLAPPAEIPAEANLLQQQTPKTLTNQGAVARPMSARDRAVQAVERRLAGKE